MRVETVEVKTKKEALKLCPWACKIIKVCGGYKCFESITDYQIAKIQN